MKKLNGIALASLILGIIAIVTSFTIFLGVILGLISLVLGIVALVKKYNITKPIIGIILSVIAIIISIFMIFVYNNLWQDFKENIKESSPVCVYIRDLATDSEISELKSKLENIEYVENITFVNKEESLEKFKKQVPEGLLDSYTTSNNPFNAYFEIVLTDKKYRELVINIIENESNHDIISDVR